MFVLMYVRVKITEKKIYVSHPYKVTAIAAICNINNKYQQKTENMYYVLANKFSLYRYF